MPAFSVTGGPETLHQICDAINTFSLSSAYIVYIDSKEQVVKINPPKEYQKYNIKVSDFIEDNSDNLVLTSETDSFFLRKILNAKKGVIFLSLDYSFPAYKIGINKRIRYSPFLGIFRFPLYFFAKIKWQLFGLRYYKTLPVKKMKGFKLSFNCKYELAYLNKNGIIDAKPICGPISNDYFDLIPESKQDNRKNVILYNPAKGKKFTLKIISLYRKRYPHERPLFIPIEKMTNAEVQALLLTSKVYIDFGYFPGPERIPRQAVLLGCNIVTSKLGAAAFDDIRVPQKYKFDVNKKSLPEICDAIHELLANYSNHFNEFEEYRKLVIAQKDSFVKDVINFIKD